MLNPHNHTHASPTHARARCGALAPAVRRPQHIGNTYIKNSAQGRGAAALWRGGPLQRRGAGGGPQATRAAASTPPTLQQHQTQPPEGEMRARPRPRPPANHQQRQTQNRSYSCGQDRASCKKGHVMPARHHVLARGRACRRQAGMRAMVARARSESSTQRSDSRNFGGATVPGAVAEDEEARCALRCRGVA
jgi:hypothetical protein